METRRGLNAIEVRGQQFLLTATAGDAVHLTREAGRGESGRPAVPDRYVGDFRQTYDLTAARAPKWAETTLCGRPWILMEADRDGENGEASDAPSCRGCLALLDRLFPAPKLNDRFPLIVRVIADTVLEYGTADITDVPGDQQAALRREVRAEVRKRTGFGLTTHAHESMVIFVCDPIYQLHADDPVSPQPPTHLSWGTWAAA
jgi:hypothetical protein